MCQFTSLLTEHFDRFQCCDRSDMKKWWWNITKVYTVKVNRVSENENKEQLRQNLCTLCWIVAFVYGNKNSLDLNSTAQILTKVDTVHFRWRSDYTSRCSAFCLSQGESSCYTLRILTHDCVREWLRNSKTPQCCLIIACCWRNGGSMERATKRDNCVTNLLL